MADAADSRHARGVVLLLVMLAVFVVVDVLVWRWGVDSRQRESGPEVWKLS